MMIIKPEIIKQAAGCLCRGGIIVYPTDTAYGIGVDAGNPKSVELLYRLKGRDFNKPTHVIVRDWKMISQVCVENSLAKKLYDNFMPGPLTMVLPSRGVLAPQLEAGTGTIGVRIPKCQFTQKLSQYLDFAYTTPSANRAGEITPYSISDVKNYLGLEEIDLVIDGGELAKVMPSTVVDLTGKNPKIIRAGPISLDDIMYT